MVLEFWSISLISIKTIIHTSGFTAIEGAVFLLIFDDKKYPTAVLNLKRTMVLETLALIVIFIATATLTTSVNLSE
ncbi:MAG: hypothetical protein COB13_003950 [OCS116 cluster bacterium]|uniref:Copper resistance protein D domain-containing protein n=1 Tax=OCS116 cluster bacterium TaxID=2030921 RepID=A0A2A4YWD5_9PROT|nr:hypothetical protein [OCS116 cluster bacterium]